MVVILIDQVGPLEMIDILVLSLPVLAMSAACVIGYYGVYGIVYMRQFVV
jgi:hypothetical protein